ncbi:bromodomain-containing protein 4A-like isoform X5 [Dermacentor silvarum]|uniref:bromodomain-containing protein 4A-like isoform X5 n=1 Tax=Dermacentor silvarum TaxID=543639 RepID=UPI0021018832|nr:bromodomain-containing protein 4A-like isoform X5 [Dermacentor silvarum]
MCRRRFSTRQFKYRQSVTQPIVPELPNIGGAPSIRKRITDQEQTRVVAATSPAENPPLPSDTAGESGISQRDERCTVNVSKSSPSCKSSMYHFDQNTRLCRRTCSDQAPFQSKSECDGVCRSVLVCFDKKRPQPCETYSSKIVYYFDAQKGKCFARTSCTHTGNNFPTIQECKLTCGAYIGQTGVDQEIALAPSNERPSQQLSEGAPSQETPPSIGSEGTTPAEGNVVSPNGRPAFTIPAVGTPLPPNRPHAGGTPAISEPAMPMPPTTGAAPATPEESKPDTSDAGIIPAIPTQDHRCSVIVSKVTDMSCKSQMYYFDSRTRLCNPTCSEMAPFHSRVACIGICRSVLVCFVKRLPNICGGNRNITVYYYNPRKGRCFVEKGCTYKGNNFPTLGECQRTCGAFTGLEEPSEEESSNGNRESTNELPLEQPEESVREQVPSTTPVPTIPPAAAPSGTGIVSSAPQNEPVTVGPPTTTLATTTLPITPPFETGITPAVPHHVTGAHEPALDSGIHVITSPSQPSSQVHHMQYHPNTPVVPPALPHISVHHVNRPIPPPLVREAEHINLDRRAVPKPPPFNISLVTPVQQPVTQHQIQPAIAQKHSSTVKASTNTQVGDAAKTQRPSCSN